MNENGKKVYTSFLVSDIDLAYNIIADGHLDKLCRVAANKYKEGARIYFFDKDDAVGKIIEDFYAERKAARNG